MILNLLGFFVVVFGLLFVTVGYVGLSHLPEGPNEIMLKTMSYSDEERTALLEMGKKMRQLAAIIRGGSRAFIKIQFRTIAAVTVCMGVIFTLFIEYWSGPAFILGAGMSSLAVIVGMTTSTLANVRVAERARHGKVGKTVWVALRGGSVIGICVQVFGTLGILILWALNPLELAENGHGVFSVMTCNASIMRFTSYSLGCSLVAMFSRIAGGIFTKAADMAADIVGKVMFDLEEDDAKNPATVADFVGDNVSDVGGNCPDLLESYVATIVSSLAAAVFYVSSLVSRGEVVDDALFSAMTKFPIMLAVCGLLSSIIGLTIMLLRKNMSEDPGKELDAVTYATSGLILVFSFVGSYAVFSKVDLPSDFRFGWMSIFIVCVIGILSGVVISKITEYFTSEKYKPTQDLSKISWLGSAFLLTMVDALGSISSVTAVVLVISVQTANWVCGSYGIAIAALGMLSFVGATVSIDAFGPIADNAGGIVESCGLPESTRFCTDKCDAAGNTTAAIAKGFAIGGAAYAAISMNATFASAYGANLSLLDTSVVGGGILGAVAIKFFIGLLDKDTLGGAEFMAAQAIAQLSDKDIIEGEKQPDYNTGIITTTKYAQRKTVLPAMLCIFAVVGLGILCGGEEVGGILYGMTLVAIVEAIFMGNSGGAADNNKKYIESGEFAKSCAENVMNGGADAVRKFIGDELFIEGELALNYDMVMARAMKIYGKRSEIHKASVVCDTIGDPRKDVDGVSLDIFIKMASTSAVIFAPLFRELQDNVLAKVVVVALFAVAVVVVYWLSKAEAKSPALAKKTLNDILVYSDGVNAKEEVTKEELAEIELFRLEMLNLRTKALATVTT